MVKAIFFDLDGTLLPMDEDLFVKFYIGNMAKKFVGSELSAEKLPNGILLGLKAMFKNTGERTNEEVFWEAFDGYMGKYHEPFVPMFNEYYANDFIHAKQACGFNPVAKKIIDLCKEKNIRTVLATNPVFPHMATYQRTQWAGLDIEDFELITTYEDSHACKPNPLYYKEILEKCNLQPEEVIMIGNDIKEDFAATLVGIPMILVTDTVKGDADSIECLFKGTLAEVKTYLESIL